MDEFSGPRRVGPLPRGHTEPHPIDMPQDHPSPATVAISRRVAGSTMEANDTGLPYVLPARTMPTGITITEQRLDESDYAYARRIAAPSSMGY